ncbi:uncharacterized protein LOC105221500 [Zeugodacus cucurbitae]|uniref:uncharacterized protein LOC105221500 n=1 Tax=Zeugodacus cucurbitae TaxID=28588 RepID=UPI0005968F9D|nr:uncharacterized protein LOC105221500 [Zeugodacus cucurbitae]
MLTVNRLVLIFHFALITGYPSLYWNLQQQANEPDLSEIINNINLERKIYAFLIVNAYNTSQSCLGDETIKTLSTNNTVKLLQAHSHCSYSFEHVNDENLLIRCLPESFSIELLDTMVSCLGNRRNTRILFIWNDEYTSASSQKLVDLQKYQQLLFQYCAKIRLLNVIAIYRDYLTDGHFYTFSYFPEFHLERKPLDEDCFPNRVKDLKGIAIRTVPDQLEPWSLVWRDGYGNVNVGGFLTKIVREFARRSNGTVSYPMSVTPENVPTMPELRFLLQNDSIDIVAGTGTINEASTDVTGVIFPIDWIIMLPLPAQIPDSEIFLMLLNSSLGLFLFILLFVFSFVLTLEALILRRRAPAESCLFFFWIMTNVVLRSVIGQPSCAKVRVSAKLIKRFLYMTLFLSGIFMSTLISAGLQSYLTSPVRYPRISTFKELMKSGITVKVSQAGYNSLDKYMSGQFLNRMKTIFISSTSMEKLQRQRTYFDTRYGYTMFSNLWAILARYQTYLPQPLFYVSKKMYITKGMPVVLPLQKHSIFKEAFNTMINQLHCFGLTDLWKRQVYEEMIAAKKLNATYHKGDVRSEELDLEDFYWLWWLYGIGMGMSTLVFFAELWYSKKTTQKTKVEQKVPRRRAVKRRAKRVNAV